MEGSQRLQWSRSLARSKAISEVMQNFDGAGEDPKGRRVRSTATCLLDLWYWSFHISSRNQIAMHLVALAAEVCTPVCFLHVSFVAQDLSLWMMPPEVVDEV